MTGEHQITFFHDGKIKTWGDSMHLTCPIKALGSISGRFRSSWKVCREHD